MNGVSHGTERSSTVCPALATRLDKYYLLTFNPMFNDKTQPETANFAPVTPPKELDETYALAVLVTDSVYLFYYVKTSCYLQNQKYSTIALLSEKDRVTATGNMYRKYGQIWTVVFETSQRTNKQTDIQTRWSQYLAPEERMRLVILLTFHCAIPGCPA